MADHILLDPQAAVPYNITMFMPIGDDNRNRKRTPIVTYILIALNVVVFLAQMSFGDQFTVDWSVVPSRLLSNPLTDWITIFSAMFMHAGLAHIGGNMLYLWIFGDNVEDRLGPWLFLIFYFFCGVAATIAQVVVDPGSNIPNLGASGAIAGVLGAYLLLYPRQSVLVVFGYRTVPVPALIVIGLWFALQLFGGFGQLAAPGEGGVAYMAHVGGFVAGLLGALPFRAARQANQQLYDPYRR